MVKYMKKYNKYDKVHEKYNNRIIILINKIKIINMHCII